MNLAIRQAVPAALCLCTLLLTGCSHAPAPAPLPSASPKPVPPPTSSATATAAPTAAPVSNHPRLKWHAPPISKSVIRVPYQIKNPPRDFLRVPQGFKVQLVAEDLEHPRWLTVAPNGDLFVVESRLEVWQTRQPNRVTVLRDSDGDGVAETRHLWADGLNLPFGIAFHNGYLYVANTGTIVRWPYRDGEMAASQPPETVIQDIPERGFRQHWTRNILFSDTERRRLYVTIGSKENAAIEEPLRGTIVAYALDASGTPGGKPQIIASGMRNPVGLALQPGTGKLWTVVNERDYLGDNLVPDFLTEVREGGFYGWPYYYIGPHHDPRLPERPDLKRKVLLPDVLLGSHGAPLGLIFTADGRAALIARHGSQNRSRMTGFDIVCVRFDASHRPVGDYTPIVTGWLPSADNKAVYGRPAGLALAKNGSLLIADDWGGRIWRVTPGPQGF